MPVCGLVPRISRAAGDSMDFLNAVVAIHEQTGIEIPERDYPKLSTLNDAASYLGRAQRQAAGA